jgi:TPR repeat protein
VDKDYVEAYKWLNLSAAQGYTNAINSREIVLRQLKPEQVNEAQQRALDFKPAK